MEQFEISVTWNQENHHFQVRDYMHHRDDQCKYEIFKGGQFVGSLEPGPHKHLSICKNPGIVEESLLHLIADQLESYNI
jgi:hypothetical protein